MRFSLIALAAFACGASAVCAASSPDTGSLEALLDRIASRHDGHNETNSSVVDDVGTLVASAEPLAPTPTNKVVRRSRAKANTTQEKRWVWATEVIQDGAPNAPPVGQNVNQLAGAPIAITTPAANLPAPSYLPPGQLAAYLNGTAQHANISTSNSSSTLTTAAAQTPSSAPVRRTFGKVFGQPKADHRRWIWATSVIQDGATDVPPPGTNANLLSNGAPANTPSATLVSPTFPPEPAVTTTESGVPQSLPTEAAISAPAVAVAGASLGDPSTSSASSEPMDPATAMLFDLFRKIQAGFEELLHSSASDVPSTSTSVPTNDKRWVWATSVIQDGATGVPPPGQNANLLTTPAMPATTPAANLVSPSFPPVASSSSSAAAASSSAANAPGVFGQRPVQVIAAVPVPPAAVPPPAANSATTPAAPSATSPSGRVTWVDNQNLLLASASSFTTSSASAAVSPSRRVAWVDHQNLLRASASSASAAARQSTAGQAYRHKQRMVRARRH